MPGDDTNALNEKFKPLDFWKEEIKSGLRYRRIFGKTQEWTQNKNMYRGFWGKGVVPVNIVYATGRSLIPQLYFRNPRIHVISKLPGMSAQAAVLEQADNYIIRETSLKEELKSLVLDCFLCGRGPGIIGYDSEFGFNPKFPIANWQGDSSLTSFNSDGEYIEYNDCVKPGMPWFLRCSPQDFVVPWGTHKWSEARWFAFRKMRTLEDIQEDPKYTNSTNLKAPYNQKMETGENTPEIQARLSEEQPQHKWVELWQIHDKKTGHVFVISLDHDKFLRDDIDYLQVEGLPAEVLGFNEDPDIFWWAPDVRMIKEQQDEMNDVRTMAKLHRKVALLKVLYDKSAIGKDELTKLLDQDPKAAVGVDTGSIGDIRKAVTLFQSHVPPDLSLAAREIREDIREIIGFSRNQMGGFEAPSGRRTAYEASVVQGAAMIRVDERRDIMADLLERVIRKHNQLIFEHWTEDRVVDVVGQDGLKYWVKFNGRQIRGEYAYAINPEESIPSDQRVRREDYKAFMEIAMKIPGMNMKYLLEEYGRQFDNIDPKMLMPGNGAGRSPERPMDFNQFAGQNQGGGMAGLGGGGY